MLLQLFEANYCTLEAAIKKSSILIEGNNKRKYLGQRYQPAVIQNNSIIMHIELH